MSVVRKGFIVMTGLAILGWVVICFPGCATSQSGPMMAQPRSLISDVPMPLGFKMKELRSRSWISGSLRFVDHLYYGNGDRITVVDFFEKQMPVNGWAALYKQFAQGRSTLDFAKGGENCRITVYKDRKFSSTYVQIAIWKGVRKAKK